MTAPPFIARLLAGSRQRPALAATALLLAAYAVYLPWSGYDQLYYDAAGYWWLAGQHYASGRFSLLTAASPLRGYVLPLLLAPLTRLAAHGWPPIAFGRMLGAATAALLWGAALPALWRAVRGPAAPVVPLARRLLLGLVGGLLWRDYFNFPLTDFPALLALCVGLAALLRGRSLGMGLLAGAALAAAGNLRPVFLAALPCVVLLAGWPLPGRPRRWPWRRAAGAALGAALVLAPQLWLNATALHETTPFVIGHDPEGASLYLSQLGWGLRNQKYESNVGTDYPSRQMYFRDPTGEALLRRTGREELASYGEYLALAAAHPFAIAGTWGRHLFNGLDLQYPTPYIRAVYVPTWGLAGLNYSLLFGGGLVLLAWRRARPWPAYAPTALALAALLLPCLASLPVAIECRFLLPLHTLLTTALVYGAQPVAWWQAAPRRRRIGAVVAYAGVLAACFALSAAAQRQLESGGRSAFRGAEQEVRPW